MVVRPGSRYHPRSEVVRLTDLHLTSEELAAEAVRTAKVGVLALASLGLEPTEALRQRAEGDPQAVAAFVAAHRLAETEQGPAVA